jgi:hypothetical protein
MASRRWLNDDDIYDYIQNTIQKAPFALTYVRVIHSCVSELLYANRTNKERLEKIYRKNFANDDLVLLYIIPLCVLPERNHWALALYYAPEQKMYVYDSLLPFAAPSEGSLHKLFHCKCEMEICTCVNCTCWSMYYKQRVLFFENVCEAYRQLGAFVPEAKIEVVAINQQLDGWSCGYRVRLLAQAILESFPYSKLRADSNENFVNKLKSIYFFFFECSFNLCMTKIM